MSHLLTELKDWFESARQRAPEHQKVELAFRVMEILVMQLADLKSVADGLGARLSQIEADVAQKIATAAAPAGLSAADQALLDEIGSVLSSVNSRLDALHATIVPPAPAA